MAAAAAVAVVVVVVVVVIVVDGGSSGSSSNNNGVFIAIRKNGPIALSSEQEFGRQESTRDEVNLFPPGPHTECGLEDCRGLQGQSTQSTTPRRASG